MMAAKVTETFSRLIIPVKTYFPSVHLLVHYISVNISVWNILNMQHRWAPGPGNLYPLSTLLSSTLFRVS